MKSCPSCKTQYSDDTLQFCLQDRTPLTGLAETEAFTVVLDETETVVGRKGPDRVGVPLNDTAWSPSQVTRVAAAIPEKKGSNTAVAIILTALGMLVVFGLIGFAALVFWRNSQSTASNSGNTASVPGGTVNTNYNSLPIPQSTPTPKPASTRTSATPGNTDTTVPLSTNDDVQTRSEVSQRVYGWKSSLESHDFNGYMGNYAPTVDYYKRRGVSSGTIRADKARAFSLYNSMRVNVSNMSVSTDPSGDTATAVFDKEWVFAGGGRSEGKTRSQLEFRRINGRWLITAERDLKLYYKR